MAGHEEIEGVARLSELWPNLRAAFDWACATNNTGLAKALLHPVVAEVYMRSRSEIGEWAERLLAIAPADDLELIRFAVTWAARRYMRMMDGESFERLVAPHTQLSDDPMINFARSFINADREGTKHWAPLAATQLEAEGEAYLAAVSPWRGWARRS